VGVAASAGQIQPFYARTRGISRRHRFDPLKTELNPTCHFLALLGSRYILHVSRIMVKESFHFPPPLSSLHTILLTLSHSFCFFLRKTDANLYNLLAWKWFLPSQKCLFPFLCLHLSPCIVTDPTHFCHYHYVTFNFHVFSLFCTFFELLICTRF